MSRSRCHHVEMRSWWIHAPFSPRRAGLGAPAYRVHLRPFHLIESTLLTVFKLQQTLSDSDSPDPIKHGKWYKMHPATFRDFERGEIRRTRASDRTRDVSVKCRDDEDGEKKDVKHINTEDQRETRREESERMSFRKDETEEEENLVGVDKENGLWSQLRDGRLSWGWLEEGQL